MVTLEQLDQIEAFQDLDDNQLSALLPLCEKIDFRRGEKLFKEGDPAQHLWVVMNGKVDLRFELPGDRPTSADNTISTHDADDEARKKILGWSCFVPPHKMRLSAYCTTRSCQTIRIAKKNLIELFEKDPLMGYHVLTYLIKVVGYRFHQFQEELAREKGQAVLHSW
ncbi:MAG: cyclic nucleotide-binding domain-containing protein [Deltaproteobacteria bacterium]|nr:cyclic nucleotide-binding domain-containing protein [Deltaproteobacteria bacterium]